MVSEIQLSSLGAILINLQSVNDGIRIWFVVFVEFMNFLILVVSWNFYCLLNQYFNTFPKLYNSFLKEFIVKIIITHNFYPWYRHACTKHKCEAVITQCHMSHFNEKTSFLQSIDRYPPYRYPAKFGCFTFFPCLVGKKLFSMQDKLINN